MNQPIQGRPLDAAAALRASMLGYISQNQTHAAVINKNAPGSDILPAMKKARIAHGTFVEKLNLDKTKTPEMKKLMASRSAQNQIETLLGVATREKKNSNALKAHLEGRIDAAIKVAGTTDLLLRTQTAALIQQLPWPEVMSLIRDGDVETVKALNGIPILQAKFKLKSDPKRAEALRVAGEEAILGANDYKELDRARAIDNALENYAGGLMEQFAANTKTADDIQASIVESES